MSMDWWIDNMGCVHTMSYYSMIQRNGILVPAIAQMSLRNVLSERRQMQKYS